MNVEKEYNPAFIYPPDLEGINSPYLRLQEASDGRQNIQRNIGGSL